MDHAGHYRLLLADFGRAVGAPELVPDEDGYCGFRLDDAVLVQLQLNPHTGDLTLFSALGPIDAGHRAAITERLLNANLFWQGTDGGTLGLDLEGEQVVLARQVPIGQLDGPGFVQAVERFSRACDAWREYLVELPRLLDRADGSGGAAAELQTYGMIRG